MMAAANVSGVASNRKVDLISVDATEREQGGNAQSRCGEEHCACREIPAR